MKINIKSKNIELDDSLQLLINKRFGEIEKFLGVFASDNYQSKGREKVEIWVEVEKTTRHHLKGAVFRAEAQLFLPRKKLRAVVVHEDLNIAINEAKEELQREIRKYKGKRIDKARRWARQLKERVRAIR